MHVIVTGGTGMIGRELVSSLAQDGHTVTILSRSPGNAVNLPAGVEAIYWDGKTAEGWADQADGADAIVNLAAESIGGSGLLDIRWTPERRKRILNSRLNAGRAVVEAIRAAGKKPAVLIQASAVGYYGTRTGDAAVTEDFGPGNDFLADVCVKWEAVTAPVEKLGVRRVVLRMAVVLSTHGGALPSQMLPFKLFAGGPIGSGEQWYPWVHIEDAVRVIRRALETESMRGVYNVASPTSTTNAEFGKALAAALNRPYYLRAPAFAFNLAFGDAAMTLLEGQKAVPQRLQEEGFTFEYSDPEAAVRDLIETQR